MVGIFCSTIWNPAGPEGLLSGGGFTQIFKQIVAVVFTSAWSFFFTLLILWIINKFTPVKIDQSTMGEDLDSGMFGERAYAEEK